MFVTIETMADTRAAEALAEMRQQASAAFKKVDEAFRLRPAWLKPLHPTERQGCPELDDGTAGNNSAAKQWRIRTYMSMDEWMKLDEMDDSSAISQGMDEWMKAHIGYAPSSAMGHPNGSQATHNERKRHDETEHFGSRSAPALGVASSSSPSSLCGY